jgi:hypothetical protein
MEHPLRVRKRLGSRDRDARSLRESRHRPTSAELLTSLRPRCLLLGSSADPSRDLGGQRSQAALSPQGAIELPDLQCALRGECLDDHQ